MKFVLEIDLTTDAFQHNQYYSIVQCLTGVIRKLEKDIPTYSIFDVNGNKVGRYDIVKED